MREVTTCKTVKVNKTLYMILNGHTRRYSIVSQRFSLVAAIYVVETVIAKKVREVVTEDESSV